MEFPYVVIRWMAAVYTRRSVEFVMSLDRANKENVYYIVTSDKENTEGRTNTDVLIEVMRAESRQYKLRMCVVLSEKECVYIEPSGQLEWSDSPPGGGVNLKNVKR